MTNDMAFSSVPPAPEEGIDLLEILTAFVVEWRRGLAWALGTFVVAAVVILAITPLYEATASLLPPNKSSGSSAAASFFSAPSPGEVYIGLLQSRSVADEVVDRAGLMALYRSKSRGTARTKLASRSTFVSGKDTLVVLKVRDRNAEAATRIANAYLDALETQQERMAIHESETRRHFFQKQLVQEVDALSAAEQGLMKVQQATGVLQPEAQTQIGLNAIAGVRAQIVGLEVQLSRLLLSDSEGNSEVKALRGQLARLQATEARMESANGPTGAGAAASAGRMPELNLDYARKSREVKYHETLVSSLASQYENARLGEEFTGSPFQVVDRAIVAEKKAWPPRMIMFLLAGVGGVIVGLLAVAWTLLWRKIERDPVQQKRLTTIRNSFRPASARR